MTGGIYYFVIVNKFDEPIYEVDVKTPTTKDEKGHSDDCLIQFIAHASLDLIDECMWNSDAIYFKNVDKYNEWMISAFVTASKLRFIMVHDVVNDDGIKGFFYSIYENYVKVSMNPFYKIGSKIKCPAFDDKVKMLCKKYLII